MNKTGKMKGRSLYIVSAFIAATLFTGCAKDKYIDEAGNLVPKTAEQDPSLPSILVNGALLHAEAFGPPDSAMVVVLHGGPGGDYRYLLKSKALADQGYRVVFYDQRGSGLSQRFPHSSYSMEVITDELQGVIDHYRTSPSQKVFLFGHSWGAMLASAFVNEHPAEIDGLVLGEPGGLVWQDVKDYVGRSWSSGTIMSESVNDATYLDQMITGKGSEHEILDYKYSLFTSEESSLLGNEGRFPFWRVGYVSNRAMLKLGDENTPDWTTNLHLYTTKVLFLYSENNQAYGREWAQRVSSAYPNVELFEVKEAGHDFPAFEKGWNHSYPVILNYLNSLK